MRNETKHLYRFDDFRLDSEAKILYHGEKIVPLKPKAIETLAVLIENAGSVVSKTDLMNAVWQDSFVEENNLSVNIYALRKAFGEFSPAENYIETVPRRGFRFAATVKKIAGEAANEPQPLAAPPENFAAEPEANAQTTARETTSDNFTAKRKKFAAKTSLGRYQTAVAVVLVCVFGGGSFYALNNGLRQSLAAKNGVSQTIRENRGTQNLEAYQFYLRGRELWQTRQNDKMSQGIEFFRRAIELDPSFAAAYVGIADSLSMMRNDLEEWRQAEEYARKAESLAPDSAEVHATLGFISAMNKWDWRAAENEFQTALALDPHSGKAHQWYATLLVIQRRFDEAESHLKQAIEIEPLSPNYNADLCELYYFAHRYDEALTQCRRTNEINPNFYYATSMSSIYIQQKRYDEAARELLKAYLRLGVSEEAAQNQEWYKAYKKDGFEGWMKSDIEKFKNYSDVLLGTTHLSSAYAQLGDREKSLEYLEKAFNGHAFLLPFANARPEFDSMRGDARFQSLMRRIGLNQ